MEKLKRFGMLALRVVMFPVVILMGMFVGFTFNEFFNFSPPVSRFVLSFVSFITGIAWFIFFPNILSSKKEAK